MPKPNPKELMKFRADPVLRRAIKLRAAYQDLDQQDVIVAALRIALAEEIREIERRGLVADQKPEGDSPGRSRRKTGGTE